MAKKKPTEPQRNEDESSDEMDATAQFLKKHGWTQADLARRLHMKPSTVSKRKKKSLRPEIAFLLRLADNLIESGRVDILDSAALDSVEPHDEARRELMNLTKDTQDSVQKLLDHIEGNLKRMSEIDKETDEQEYDDAFAHVRGLRRILTIKDMEQDEVSDRQVIQPRRANSQEKGRGVDDGPKGSKPR